MTDPDILRRQLARWTTGICVMTAAGRDGVPLGKCANSFHSVSLTPPLVGWCVDVASTRYQEWVDADGYAVHILGSGQADLVARFARRGGDKFDGLAWEAGAYGAPLIDGALLRLVCRTRDRFPAGDHTYLIGEVTAVEERPDDHPLLFHGGRPSTLQDLAGLYDPEG